MTGAAICRAPETLALARLSRGGARLRDRLAAAMDEAGARGETRRPHLEARMHGLVAGLPDGLRRQGRALSARLEAEGVLVVGLADPDYPATLAALPDPPPALFVRGSLLGLQQRCLAVTGARSISPWARGQGRTLGHLARRCGFTLVAGWTSRSEEAAVRGALGAPGEGRVILVQPYGPEVGPGEGGVLRRVLDGGGAVVSAWPPGLPPLGRAHPRRSQLLAALADDMVVLQAGPASGALAAARRALEQGAGVWVPAAGLEETGGRPRGGRGLLELRASGALSFAHPLLLALPDLPGIPWRPKETRVAERCGAVPPDRLLAEGKFSRRSVERRTREGWLYWTPDGRIGPGFEPILRAMCRRS